jgi:hypothetical protein
MSKPVTPPPEEPKTYWMYDPELGEKDNPKAYVEINRMPEEDLPQPKKPNWFKRNSTLVKSLCVGLPLAVAGIIYYRYHRTEQQTANQIITNITFSPGQLIVDGQQFDGLLKENVIDRRHPKDKADKEYYLVISDQHMNSHLLENDPKKRFTLDKSLEKNLEYKYITRLDESNLSFWRLKDKTFNGYKEPATRRNNIMDVWEDDFWGKVKGDIGPTRFIKTNKFKENATGAFYVEKISAGDYKTHQQRLNHDRY